MFPRYLARSLGIITAVSAAILFGPQDSGAQEVRITPALGIYLPLGVGGKLIDERSLYKAQIQTGILFGRALVRAEPWLDLEAEAGWGRGMLVIRDSSRSRVVTDVPSTLWMLDLRGLLRLSPAARASRRLSPYVGLGAGVVGRHGEAYSDTPARTRPSGVVLLGVDAALGRRGRGPAVRFELSDRFSRAQFNVGLPTETRARIVHDIVWSWGISFRVH